MAGNLNGRLARLEATLRPLADHCRTCGLRHASGPMTLALLRSIFRVEGGTGAAAAPRTRLCLCDLCCGDPRDRWLARLSHGLDAT
jgi:hypothetical protein